MAVEDIGVLVPTKIPGLADAADIQEALRVYHYGGSGYEATSAQTSLPAVGIARRLLEISDDITALENRPSSGGDVDTDAPVAGDFTPSGIPNGYIWVDENGSLGGAPTGATAVFTNSAPTTSITTGTIWVDKDSTTITANPFIPTATINAKGDLLVGSANDSIVTLSAGTNGYSLIADSSTTSGLTWTNTLTSPILNTPAANYAVLKSPEEKFNVVASAATGTINIDMETAGIWYYTSDATANHTLNFRYNSSTTLNNSLTTGDAITFVWMNTNGATPYYPSAITVDGSSVTPKFQNGTAFSAGNASSVDIYTYTVLKTGNAAFTVFAGQTKFA
jgi:hypothetical protein